ncbi:MAG: hypothetical protein ACR2N4_02965 [Jatrophihabitans sp.]
MSTAHLPYRTEDQPGTQIIALVNPQHPDYAELPGSPMTVPAAWKLEAGFAVFFGLMLLAMIGLAARLSGRPAAEHARRPTRSAP